MNVTHSFISESSAFRTSTLPYVNVDCHPSVDGQIIIAFYPIMACSIRNKKTAFTTAMKGRKNVFVSFATTFGVKNNIHSQQVMDNQAAMDSLFEKLN